MSKIFRQSKEYKSNKEMENNPNETIEIIEESEDFKEETKDEVVENSFVENEIEEIEDASEDTPTKVLNGKGKIVGSTLVKLRKGPSFDSDIIRLLTFGSEVIIESTTLRTNGFIACSFAGDSGYVAREYIEEMEE